MYSTGVFLVVFLTHASSAVPASADEREALTGVEGFRVVVETLDHDARAAGLTEENVQAYVELQLRRNGIAVVHDYAPGGAVVYLRLSVLAMYSESGIHTGYAYSVTLDAREYTKHPRPPHAAVVVTLWEKGSLGIASPTSTSRAIRDSVTEKLERLCNDYLAANVPRTASSPWRPDAARQETRSVSSVRARR